MELFTPEQRAFAQAMSSLTYCNPFLPERIQHEKEALGREFRQPHAVWSRREDILGRPYNLERMVEKTGELLGNIEIRAREAPDVQYMSTDLDLLSDVVIFYIYHTYQQEFDRHARKCAEGQSPRVSFYNEFEEKFRYWGRILPGMRIRNESPAHWFAIGFQVRRAFNHIFDFIVGESLPAARLRASAWQSIFTYDIRRYARAFHDRMHEFTCLITGPSGTGKELVARAIAFSRFVPFDRARECFADSFSKAFFPLNLSALSPTLIESELFGHRKGSFTGAANDKAGYFEVCPLAGSVFLDEIGELDGSIQVKLLRLLQSRTFQRIGETDQRLFRGKFMAATNRDLLREIEEGRFREDLYYRLCGDVIVTPTLREQLQEWPEALSTFVHYIVGKLSPETESEWLSKQVLDWIQRELPDDYPWPGNVRELEQCIRNVLIRGHYRPLPGRSKSEALSSSKQRLAGQMVRGELTMEQLQQQYCSLIYALTGNYIETARRLGVDHRTVKTRVLPELVEQFKA